MKAKYFLPITGLTLIELLIVVIIIGILVTIAMPIYNKAVERSRMAEAYSQLGLIKQAELDHYAEYWSYTGQFGLMNIDNPNSDPNRYFNYVIKFPTPVTIEAVRNGYNNPFNFTYRLIMNTDWVITVTGF